MKTAAQLPWLEKTQSDWHHQVSTQQLGHAYLWTGVSGLGKRQFIQHCAQALLCQESTKPCGACQACHWQSQGTHPDYYEAPLEGSIGIDVVRQWIEAIYKTPMVADYAVVVIPDSERMTLAAANALLKALEEPPPYCVWLMSSSQISQLPPTILSRVQKTQIPSVDPQVCEQWVREQTKDFDASVFALARQLYGEAPLKIAALMRKGAAAARQDFFVLLSDFLSSKTSLEKTYQACWPKHKQDILVWVITLMFDGLRQQADNKLLLMHSEQSDLIHQIAVCRQDRVWQWYDELMEYRRSASLHVNFGYWFYTWLYFLKKEASHGLRV